MQPTDRVLDVGCGTGRMALPLTRVLTTGTYDGFDIVKDSIAWCQRAYRRYPNFRFHHADLMNPLYNAQGTIRATAYRFPVADASIDFCFLTSVFTHMRPDEVDHYLSEIARVLAPGGRGLITWFLLNDSARQQIQRGDSAHRFAHDGDGYWFDHPKMPEAAIAYEEHAARERTRAHGLTIGTVRYGQWCHRTDGTSWQDLMLVSNTIAH